CVNTQRRDSMVKRARTAYAWTLALQELDPTFELAAEMQADARQARDQLDNEIRRSFQHYAFLVRDDQGLRVEIVKFEDDRHSALSGNHVWADLVQRGDAADSSYG